MIEKTDWIRIILSMILILCMWIFDNKILLYSVLTMTMIGIELNSLNIKIIGNKNKK
jgi:hypothetical protein